MSHELSSYFAHWTGNLVCQKKLLALLASPRTALPMEARGWDSPIGLALAGREIYTPERLLIYSSIMTQEANSYPILLLALSRKKGCNVGWQESGLQFQDKPIFLCRTGLSLRKYLELRVKEGD